MLIGYARTSTTEQVAGLEAQIRDLGLAGCEKIFSEHGSGVDAARPELAKAIEFAREGDVFVVTKPERLARSVAHLTSAVEGLKRRGVAVRILSMNLDTTSATGELILNVLASIGAFERSLMLERQREGIAKAKGEGKYLGRKPTARLKAGEVLRLHASGKHVSAIAKELGIGRGSVYRALEAAQQAPAGIASALPAPG
jgi:DNA invertase Pin-like site-specific DNA recombinase